MADIKQAAKWMKAGKRTHRKIFPEHHYFSQEPKGARNCRDNITRQFRDESPSKLLLLRVSDLLADDWEISK